MTIMRFMQKYLHGHPILPTCSPLGSASRHLLHGIFIKTAQQSNMLNLSIFKMPPEPSFLKMAPQVPAPLTSWSLSQLSKTPAIALNHRQQAH